MEKTPNYPWKTFLFNCLVHKILPENLLCNLNFCIVERKQQKSEPQTETINHSERTIKWFGCINSNAIDNETDRWKKCEHFHPLWIFVSVFCGFLF